MKQKIKRQGAVWHDRKVKKISLDAQDERILAVLKWKGHEVAAVLVNFSGGTVTISRDPQKKPITLRGFEMNVVFP